MMIGSVPCIGGSVAGAGADAGTASADGGAGLRRTIGLGAVTLIWGRAMVSCACASNPERGNRAEQPSTNARTTRFVMTNSLSVRFHHGIARETAKRWARQRQRSDQRRRAGVECDAARCDAKRFAGDDD